MRVLCLALLSLISPLLIAAQYSCPQIHFAQTLTPVVSGQSSENAAFMLSFVNTSPSLPLEFLDVHFRVNNDDLQNFRLIESDRNMLRHYPIESIPLQQSDVMEYFFTYAVAGTHFACDTERFHVNGKQVLEHLNDTPVQNVLAADSPASHLSRSAALQHIAASPSASSSSGASSSAAQQFEQSTGGASQRNTRAAPAPASEDEKLDQNEGICPLIPFEQKMFKSAKSNEYTLSFVNKSPSTPLDFLDVHFRINDGPITNLRLFTDPAQANKGNDERALEGLVLAKGDEIFYAYTYGLKEQGTNLNDDGEQKVRACNTAVYHAIAA